MTPDEVLLKRYADGDAAAFNELYQRHRVALFSFLTRYLGDRQLSEDAFQETWLQVARHAGSYVASASFRTWLFTIARSRAIDRLRRQRIQSVVDTAIDPDEQPAALNGASAREPELDHQQLQAARLLHIALLQVPDQQREVFLLKEEAGLTLAEIAELLHVDYENAKSRYRYALQRLRVSLAGLREP